ncbi:hypothetical protein HYH03_010886 [Edaphochlamys debaryana]|uniref:Uncharacterized protein n=1 Tax=Edaphochlamys debaryana TaxID=47281 RepID=A0A835Y1C3_9CHLO|nr:hypothetical protein HYH03_010886 [Edaphochlamys debaryana]|eukprot:KAG2490730.1 hypothetical protein HYH03_010886 [Edaphochlamys debaryana]
MEGSPPREALGRSPEAVSRSAGPAVDPSPASPGAQHQRPGDEDAATPTAALLASLGAAAGGGAAPGASPGADAAAVTPGTAAAALTPGLSPRLMRVGEAVQAAAVPPMTPTEEHVANSNASSGEVQATLAALEAGHLRSGLTFSRRVEGGLSATAAHASQNLAALQGQRQALESSCSVFSDLLDKGMAPKVATAMTKIFISHGAIGVFQLAKAFHRELLQAVMHVRRHEVLHKEAGAKLTALQGANNAFEAALDRAEAEKAVQDVLTAVRGLEEMLGSPLAMQVGCVQVLLPYLDAITQLASEYFATTRRTVQLVRRGRGWAGAVLYQA